MNTYIIIIPDCTHPYARYDFKTDDWRSTNDLFEAWMVDETTADEAAYNFRETFGIDQGSFTISATLLTEAIEDQAAYVLTVLNYSQEVGGGIIIKGCETRATGELIVPATIGNLPVTKIENWAFAGCSGLTSVTIPDSVTNIGNSAFRSCVGLKTVNLGNSVGEIGKEAFFNCFKLAKIAGLDSVPFIGELAFFGCPKLKV